MKEVEKIKLMAFRIPESLHEEMKIETIRRKITITEFINELISKEIAKNQKKEKQN